MTLFPTRLATHRLIQISALIFAMLLQPSASADIYKWKNASGEVQYTQVPPPQGIHAEKIEGAKPPSASRQSVNREQQKLQEQMKAMEERNLEQEENNAARQQSKDFAEINKKNCVTAKNNLANLQLGGNRRYLTPDGEVVRYTEEERQQRISEANDQIKEFCKR